MIVQLPNPAAASQWCNDQRAQGRTVGYVPTMGALHDGHLSLVRRAVEENDVACVSIFVNPLQFDDPADLEKYPRDQLADIALLQQAGCDMVYVGTLLEFFPEAPSADDIVMRNAGHNGRGLEGAHRPGHLDGVRTIVERLFTTVGPCTAYFGEKDFQQSLVVRDLASDMDDINVVVCPTMREPSGLAMSSRNVRLNDLERQRASCIYRALFAVQELWDQGERDADALRAMMRRVLRAAGVAVEYADVRDPDAWTELSPFGDMVQAQALIAVRMGDVRLIDNMHLESVAETPDQDDELGSAVASGPWIPF